MKTKVLNVRVSQDSYEKVLKAAVIRKMNISEIIRILIAGLKLK